MVDKIEVVINNGVFREKEILVEPSKNLCCIDKTEYQIKDEEISKILSILSTWIRKQHIMARVIFLLIIWNF